MASAETIELDRTPAPTVVAWHALSGEEVAHELDVDLARGLTGGEVGRRRARYGPNQLAAAKAEPRWQAFVRQYHDPMQIVLLIAGIGSLWPLKQLGTGLMLLFLTAFNAVLGLQQEGKAAAAIAALQKMMIVKARVKRQGQLTEVSAEELVPGDVVSIEAGDLVPADGRLLSAATLEVNESALTGESLPVSKNPERLDDPHAVLGDRTDMVYLNTSVTRGAGEFIVTATGMATEVGHISDMLQAEETAQTPLTLQLLKLTNQILVVAGVAVLIMIVLNLSRGDDFTVVFTAAIAMAIAAIPTGLPAVVTTILSYGTQTLAQAHAIVKRLRSAETLGSTSAVNSDKTGTLTLNQMTAVEMTIPGRRYTVSGQGYSTQGRIKHVAGQEHVPLEQFLLPMILASDAVLGEDGELVGDPTEGALIVLAEKGGLDTPATRERYPRLAELPFDAAYKLMATFHAVTDESGAEVIRMFVKGAPDQLLARGGHTLDPDLRPIPVDKAFRDRYRAENQRLAEQGLRVMATARKDFASAEFDPHADLLPLVDDLTLLTLVGIVDPPRPEVKEAIATARAAGIQVRMITGDHAITAGAIAGKLGIEGRAITGSEFAAMSDAQAGEAIDGIGVIARVTPEHKVRLVEILREKGHIVAMTGDGVNDAPALKKADIGIAMGITGSEVSKEAAAMILTDDNFATIVHAVELGRGLYDNLKKYVRFQMGNLIGFIVTFLGAAVVNLLGGVPFIPLQTLYVNFTTLVFQSVGLGFGKPSDELMKRKPRKSDEPILERSTLAWLTIVGLVMGVTTLAVIAWAKDNHGAEIARTMGFTTFSIANIYYALTVKHEARSVFSLDTFDDRQFVYTTLASCIAVLFGAQLNVFNRLLKTTSLNLHEWLICIVAAISIIIASEIHKFIIRRGAQQAEQPAIAATEAGT